LVKGSHLGRPSISGRRRLSYMQSSDALSCRIFSLLCWKLHALKKKTIFWSSAFSSVNFTCINRLCC
jgi:hypothetical protein